MGITKKNKQQRVQDLDMPIPGIAGKNGMADYIRPKTSVRSRIRPIGNSKGVILSNQLLKAAGLDSDADIVIQAADGIIYIFQMKPDTVNTDLSTWDKQFKESVKKGAKPESDLFDGMANDFDLKEW